MLKQTEVWESLTSKLQKKRAGRRRNRKSAMIRQASFTGLPVLRLLSLLMDNIKLIFALGSNCVMFTYDIMKNAGLFDSLAFSGAITPGTYMAHLQDLYEMKTQ